MPAQDCWHFVSKKKQEEGLSKKYVSKTWYPLQNGLKLTSHHAKRPETSDLLIIQKSNKRPPPFFGEKSCVGLIALELAPTVNYWFKGWIDRTVAQKYKKKTRFWNLGLTTFCDDGIIYVRSANVHVRNASTYVCSANAHVRSANAEFGLRSLCSVCKL